jgi:hypothetical protein
MVTLIFGRARMGKTSLCKTLIYDVRSNLIIFDSNKEYTAYGDMVYDFKTLYERIRKKQFPIRFYHDDAEATWKFLIKVQHYTLVVDELHTYANSYETPKSLKELLRRHAHIDMSFYGLAHRYAEVHPAIRSQRTRLIIFNQHEYDDLRQLEKVGFDPAAVASLKKYEYILREI